jgi:hypothetical protein
MLRIIISSYNCAALNELFKTYDLPLLREEVAKEGCMPVYVGDYTSEQVPHITALFKANTSKDDVMIIFQGKDFIVVTPNDNAEEKYEMLKVIINSYNCDIFNVLLKTHDFPVLLEEPPLRDGLMPVYVGNYTKEQTNILVGIFKRIERNAPKEAVMIVFRRKEFMVITPNAKEET